MRRLNDQQLRSVNGGYYYHCAWCCGTGVNVDFYNELSGFLHTRTKHHKKYWANGYGASRGKCQHTGGY